MQVRGNSTRFFLPLLRDVMRAGAPGPGDLLSNQLYISRFRSLPLFSSPQRRAAEAKAAPGAHTPVGSPPPVSVAGCVLIDPVCLCLNFPTLTLKFVYKGFAWTKPDLGRYYFSRELMISATMCRKFTWSTHMVRRRRIPCTFCPSLDPRSLYWSLPSIQ